MPKPASYPFLTIARRYGVDYGDLLLVVDTVTSGGKRWSVWHHRACNAIDAHVAASSIYGEIELAHDEQRRVRDGLIDWQTGAPIFDGEQKQALRQVLGLGPL